MPKKVLEGFEIADDRTLPKIDAFMIAEFLKSEDFVQPEIRNCKTLRATASNYGDSALGYLQVRRDGVVCTVRAEICPQQRIHNKNYHVYCVVDESEDDGSILEATCEDCVACEGGCKHIIAFLFYLHRRSEEKSVTSSECLWKRPRLSAIGTTDKCELVAESHPPILPKRPVPEPMQQGWFNFLISDLQVKAPLKATALRNVGKKSSMCIHHLLMDFKGSDRQQNAENFLDFCSLHMTYEDCIEVARITQDQANSSAWHLHRHSRVTASKVWEVSRCSTEDGVLVNTILGAVGVPDTVAMARGREMEPKVLAVVNKKFGGKLARTGLLLSKSHPELGASPDGLLNDHVLEVKCPYSEKAVRTYFNKDSTEPAPKFKAQIMMQMHFCNKSKGIFCVASPSFDGKSNKEVTTIVVDKDESFIQPVLVKAREFWSEYIYPKIYETV